jgi:5-methylcytosine-specific restriction endonuclease McrA
MNKNVSKRLISDLKFKLFTDQKGVCLFCKKTISEKALLNRSTTIHIHHVVPRSLKKSLDISDKNYESRRNLTLLHENCHLVLHKTTEINKSLYLRDEIPKNPITD